MNSLVNQVLSRHTPADRIAKQLGVIPLNKFMFKAMLDGVEIGFIERVGMELGPRIIKQAFRFLDLNYDINGLIQHYFQPASLLRMVQF
jgi:hypothetical protein